MVKIIERYYNCQPWIWVHFLGVRNVKSTVFHCQVSEVYSKNAIGDGMVRKWIR